MYDFPVHDLHFYSHLCQERLLRSRKFATMATLQVGTILVAMAPEILELVTWFLKKSP